MFLRYVYKYLVVCYLVLILVINAVADISLDDFGNDEPLRSAKKLGDCTTDAMKDYCQQKCGPKHACLLGQCFCVMVTTAPDERVDEEFALDDLSIEDTASESIADDDDDDGEVDDDDEEVDDDNGGIDEEDTLPSLESNYLDEVLAARPTVRHHIAHFCPNLNVARTCIQKCLDLGKPAFCGKDHNCYCGHQYDFPGRESDMQVSDVQDQFKDLYEKYFGPKISPKSGKH